MTVRHLSARRTAVSITGALGIAALTLTVTPLAQAATTGPAHQAAHQAAHQGGAHQAADRTPHGRQVSAAEQRNVQHLDHAAVRRQAHAMPLPANRPLPKGQEAPAQGADGPAVSVAGALPTASPTASTSTGTSTSTSTSTTTSTTVTTTSTGITGALWPGGATVNPNRQVGKLYFDIDPSAAYDWRHCTATAINSENKSTVLTAGHCVFDTANHRWYTNLWFYPGYENGARLGAWPVRTMSTTGNYYNYGSSADDMAVVLVKRDSAGVPLVNRVGGQGIAFNQSVGIVRTSLGYPVTDSRWPGWTSSGEDLYYCQGRDTYYSTGSFAGQMVLACRMTGGASGGPWLSNVPSTWLGTAMSVNSNKGWTGAQGAGWMFGPYMGSQESAVFQAYRAA